MLHDKQKMKRSLNGSSTFAFVVSPEMAPTCQVTVYYLDEANDEIISDSLVLPVRSTDNVELSMKLNYDPTKCISQIELVPKMAADSTICISAVDDRHPVQGRNLLSRSRLLIETSKQDRQLKRVVFRDDFNREYFVKDYPVSHRYLDSFEPFNVGILEIRLLTLWLTL